MDNKITLYVDMMSQPCRAVVNFLKINNIPHEIKETLLSKGMNKTKEFISINPHSTVPTLKTIENGKDFILYESCTMLRYLSDKFYTPEHWYNRNNLTRRCLIDQYLDWHHSNTRKIVVGVVFTEVLKPVIEKKTGTKLPSMENQRENIPKLLKFINDELGKHDYIIDNELSIADLLLYNELIMLYLVNYDYSDYPYIEKYLSKLSEINEMKESNYILRKVVSNLRFKPKF